MAIISEDLTKLSFHWLPADPDILSHVCFISSLHSAPRQERSLFVILAWITVTFLIFHTPRLGHYC